MSIAVWNLFVHMDGAIMLDLILNLMCWGVVSVVMGLVMVAMAAVYWLDINAVGVMVISMVTVMMGIMVDIMVDVVVVNIVVYVMVGSVVSIIMGVVMSVSLVMGWLSDDWMAVVFSVVMRVSRWCYLMFFSVGVLLSVFTFVMVSWSVIGVDWLSVSMVVHIDDWVMVVGIWVVRITGWVSVNGLVLVVNSLVVDWLNFVSSIVLNIVVDGLMWSSHIVLSHVVIVMTTMSVVMINILELHLVVVFTVLVCSVVNFMFSLVINVLMSNGVMFSLTSLNMWFNLMDSGLLKRSMVRVMVWDVDGSKNCVFMVISWSVIFWTVVVVVKLWVSLVLDMVFNVWLFMMDPGYDWGVVSTVVMSILMMDIMMIVVFDVVMVIVMGIMMVVVINVVVDWLMDNFMVDLMVDWLVNDVVDIVVNIVMDSVVWGLMVVIMMIIVMVVMVIVMIIVVVIVWVVVVDVMNGRWLSVMFSSGPLGMMVNWVDISVVSSDVMIGVGPCIMVVVVTIVDSPSVNFMMVIIIVVVIEMVILMMREVMVLSMVWDFVVDIVMFTMVWGVVHIL